MVEQPRSIGRYKVLRQLGHGGMGAVYLAHDPAIDRQVAIKTITLTSASGDARSLAERRQRFLREAQAAGRLQHPNIIAVHDVGTFGEGNLFIVMEYLPGSTLDRFTTRTDMMPVERVISIISDACLALDYAHRHTIVHRDIKPSNMMLVEGRVKITDFGIAKDNRAEITQCGTLLGTPNYMSPEQAMGKATDGRSDLFSMGVVLYELLTGERPFQGDSITAVLYQLVHEEPRPPRILNDKLPEQFDHLLRMALHKNPDARFQTGQEMAMALRNHPRFEASPAQTMILTPDAVSAGNGQPDIIRRPDPAPAHTVMMPLDRAPSAPRTARSQPQGRPAPTRRASPPPGVVSAPRQRLSIVTLAGLLVALAALAVPQYRAKWLQTILPEVQGLLHAGPAARAEMRQTAQFEEPVIPAPVPVDVELVADRPGASFYVDGAPVEGSVLPWRPALAGQILSASDGCYRGEMELAIPLGDPQPLELVLDEPVVRSVELRTVPAGASVLLDGKKLEGYTPAAALLAVCDDHEVTLSLAGHHPRTLTLPAGGNWDEIAGSALRLEALPNGQLAFAAAYPVAVFDAQGKFLGDSGDVLSLPQGRHTLTFESKEHRVSVKRTFTVKPDIERNLDAPVPALGTVRVLAYPGNAVIRVDGVDAEPPPAVLQLGAGEHRIECQWNVGQGKTVHKTVLVREGQTHKVHFREEDSDEPR